jgi:hypothetical protein
MNINCKKYLSMKKIIAFNLLLAVLVFIGCDTISNLPTNTSGGIFSLNGNWELTSSNQNELEGTVVTVFPAVSDGTIKKLATNNKCLRQGDVLWRNIKSQSGGGFKLELLVNACNNAQVYRNGTLVVITNDEVRLTVTDVMENDISQTWKRVAAE